MYRQPSSSSLTAISGTTEFDILKASHKFLRDEEGDENTGNASWEDRLAQKYYASLYREFAVCDLKHFKSGNFALRWRTESEVLSGAGEETCGNTRCRHHHPLDASSSSRKELKTVELPFAYEEHGERKNALVKVVLCTSCLKKLMWKHEREKEAQMGADVKEETHVKEEEAEEEEAHLKELKRKSVGVKEEEDDEEELENMLKSKAYDDAYERRGSDKRRERRGEEKGSSRRRRNSRSLSPSSHRREREHRHKHRRKQRSPAA